MSEQLFASALVVLAVSLVCCPAHAEEGTVVEARELRFEPDARSRMENPEELSRGDGFLSELLTISDVRCEGTIRLRCNALTERLEAAGGLVLWNLSLRELGIPLSKGSSTVSKILKRDPWVESASIRADPFLRRAVLTVQEAIPWFVTELRGQAWVVSRRGALLQELSSIVDGELTVEVSQLPRVRGIEYRGVESVMREAERIRKTASLLAALEGGGGLPFEVESYELLEDGSLAITPFDATLPTVFFEGEGQEAKSALAVLSGVLRDLKVRGERASKVDLRVPGRAIMVR